MKREVKNLLVFVGLLVFMFGLNTLLFGAPSAGLIGMTVGGLVYVATGGLKGPFFKVTND